MWENNRHKGIRRKLRERKRKIMREGKENVEQRQKK